MSDLREKLVGITKSASKATGDLFKSTKLNISHANEQANLKNLYIEIGQKVHEIYRYGGSLGALFDNYYEKLTACEQKAAEIKAQLAEIKGLRDCPSCGKPVDKEADFCAKCGAALLAEDTAAQDALPTESAHTPPPAQAFTQPHELRPPAHELPPPPAPAPLPFSPPLPAPIVSHQLPSPAHELPPMPAPAPQISPPPAPPATLTCRVCNTENTPGTKFCLSCGRII